MKRKYQSPQLSVYSFMPNGVLMDFSPGNNQGIGNADGDPNIDFGSGEVDEGGMAPGQRWGWDYEW